MMLMLTLICVFADGVGSCDNDVTDVIAAVLLAVWRSG